MGLTPTGIAVNLAGTRLYVTSYANSTVSVINTATNTVVATVSLGPCPNPSTGLIGCAPTGVVVSPDGARVFVAHVIDSGDPETVLTGAISVIRTLDNSVIATLPIEAFSPDGVAVNPQGDRVYVADRAVDSVVVIDPIGLSVIATIPVGSNPTSVAVNPAGTKEIGRASCRERV